MSDPFLSKTLKKTWGERAQEISQKANCAMINLLKKRELGKFIKNEMRDLVIKKGKSLYLSRHIYAQSRYHNISDEEMQELETAYFQNKDNIERYEEFIKEQDENYALGIHY